MTERDTVMTNPNCPDCDCELNRQPGEPGRYVCRQCYALGDSFPESTACPTCGEESADQTTAMIEQDGRRLSWYYCTECDAGFCAALAEDGTVAPVEEKG